MYIDQGKQRIEVEKKKSTVIKL